MGIALTCFAIYHLNMISNDTTTNERMKRSDFINFFSEETVRLEKMLKESTNEE
jgi:palmitoyltransferase